MGELKKLVEKSVKSLKKIDNRSEAEIKFSQYKNKYQKAEGKSAVWKTKNNPTVKEPMLVRIIKAYSYHVVVEKISYAYDGTKNVLHYSIEYASILSGFDHLRIIK